MAMFKLFKKKETEKAAPAQKEAPAKPAAKESVSTKAAPKTASAPAKKIIAPAPAKATKPAPAAKPAAKPVVKAPAKQTPVAKPAPKPAAKQEKPAVKPAPKKSAAPAAVKLSSEPATRQPRNTASRPFFVTTEDDLREAFDQAIAEAERQIEKNGARAVGKYEFNLEVDGYHFYLIANNGQVLFDSPSFTTLIGALNGIKTFQKTVASGNYDLKKDKYGRFRFIFANKYYGENYTTKEQCTKSAESVQNFANNSKIIRYKPEKEALAAFEMAKNAKRSPEDVNWAAVEQAEKDAVKMGKFEISPENGEYCFYLTANNGQILYSSRYYASESACRKGIESFKRAAYVGNFFVDRDKFGNFRYVLKNIGSAPSFIGESYDNKPQCEKIIESVKNFIVTASIELSEEVEQ